MLFPKQFSELVQNPKSAWARFPSLFCPDAAFNYDSLYLHKNMSIVEYNIYKQIRFGFLKKSDLMQWRIGKHRILYIEQSVRLFCEMHCLRLHSRSNVCLASSLVYST